MTTTWKSVNPARKDTQPRLRLSCVPAARTASALIYRLAIFEVNIVFVCMCYVHTLSILPRPLTVGRLATSLVLPHEYSKTHWPPFGHPEAAASVHTDTPNKNVDGRLVGRPLPLPALSSALRTLLPLSSTPGAIPASQMPSPRRRIARTGGALQGQEYTGYSGYYTGY